jgi:hypothetical protein
MLGKFKCEVGTGALHAFLACRLTTSPRKAGQRVRTIDMHTDLSLVSACDSASLSAGNHTHGPPLANPPTARGGISCRRSSYDSSMIGLRERLESDLPSRGQVRRSGLELRTGAQDRPRSVSALLLAHPNGHVRARHRTGHPC